MQRSNLKLHLQIKNFSLVNGFMNKKIFPNFWQALLIISCWAATNLIIWTITCILIYNNNNSTLYQSIQVIAMELNYVPYIVYLVRKTNIKIWDYFALPDFDTLFKLIIVSVLLKFVISVPMDRPLDFFKSLMDSKIKLYGISFNNKFPEIVIALRLIFFPITEEILYRGLILGQFLKRYTPTKAILLSSLIFGFAHLNIESFAFLFIGGIILGIFYYKTNSILVSSISHFLFNMGFILELKNLDLNRSNLIIYTIVFLISILIIIFLLRKPLKTVKISDFIGET